jgi:hypothetical protein
MNGPAMSTTTKHEPWQQNLIKHFAKDNIISQKRAAELLVASDWNWARAYDAYAAEIMHSTVVRNYLATTKKGMAS